MIEQPTPLTDIALFDVTGADAASFLQSQLTQDVLHWQTHEIKRAAWCNPKGRMLATFYLWAIESGFRCVIARDLVDKILPRLRMFIMRSKVLVSAPLNVDIYATQSDAPALTHRQSMFTLLDSGFAISTDAPEASGTSNTDLTTKTATHPARWLQAHTLAGVVWISANNSEQFVPQTCNYELVGGVSFRKGCYPGQEVVARSQYLGKLKLRACVATAPHGMNALQDIYDASQPSPVGRVIQSCAADDLNIAMIEAPHSLFEAQSSLCLGSIHGAPLTLLPLPYVITNITA
jgi:tRNA-modifying protein YgfZ